MPGIVLSKDLTAEQIDVIKGTICKGATDAELSLFVATCNRVKLDPFARQIYWTKRGILVSIDGFRVIAERSGDYAGQTKREWCGPDGKWRDVWLDQRPPVAARVGVWRTGFKEPLYCVARYSSYVAETPVWRRAPEHMTAKCFDEVTEVLTDEGFQLFSEVTGRVLEVTEDGLRPTDAKPFVQNYDGPMVGLDSDDLNFRVTPNHDMVTTAGKIEAGAMYEEARVRARHWIPRLVQGSSRGLDISDAQIALAAAYLCDGTDRQGNTFFVSVRKPRKVQALRALGLSVREFIRPVSESTSAIRKIVPTGEQTGFVFTYETISALCSHSKVIDPSAILGMSREQARLFVDSMLFFDGNRQKKSGVRRFYSSRPDHCRAFELACVVGGYSISPWRSRISDISTRPNFHATVSARDEIPVSRYGRPYNGFKESARAYTGLELVPSTGRVWCVTVPSGVIVVRRAGFSMLCGNCAEALALRTAFPNDLSGLYTPDEMEQADRPGRAPEPEYVDTVAEPSNVVQLPTAAERAAETGGIVEMLGPKLRSLDTELQLAEWWCEVASHNPKEPLRATLWGLLEARARTIKLDRNVIKARAVALKQSQENGESA